MQEGKVECLMRQLNAYLLQYGKSTEEYLDLTPAQCVMLEHLLSCKKQTIYFSEVFEKSGITRASISSLLKTLKEKGYLFTEADLNDCRKKRIVLTEKAYETQESLKRSLRKKEACILEGISEEEFIAFEKTLEKMVFHLKNATKNEKRRD